MMNLLISIVSDTFEQVQMVQVIKDVEGQLELLQEIRALRPFWTVTHQKKYIAMVTPFSEQQENWEGRMMGIYHKITKVHQNL